MMDHHLTAFPLMQKCQSNAINLFCNFCNSMGHDKQNYHALDLMRECTLDTYRVQGENGPKGGAPRGAIIKKEEEDT
jgi:hypothetical protein